ncbi:MAG: hypothetical protein ACKOAU_15535 [Pirellula sp.]
MRIVQEKMLRLVAELNAKRKTASEYLQELERIGVMVGEKHGRETIYKHPALLEVLQK